MHTLGKTLANANYNTYALNMRGHGASSPKGDIAYIGQLEDDLVDFVHTVNPTAPSTLIGFSSGGGFALRVAGSKHQNLFSNYLLLSPFISQDAPTQRPNSGGWVEIGLSRHIAILLLNYLGVNMFNHLTVMQFALPPNAPEYLTREYSFNLAQNYRPQADYQATIHAVKQPLSVIAGLEDEAFHTDRLKDIFQNDNLDIPVTLIADVNHAGLILNEDALHTIVKTVNEMNAS
jgi:alpha-beta hydrolase superfamily lysophospholipase